MAVLNFLRERLPAAEPDPDSATVFPSTASGHRDNRGEDSEVPFAGSLDSGCPLGWVGWLGYEVGEQTLTPKLSAPVAAPRTTSGTSLGASIGSSGVESGSGGVESGRTRHPDAAFIYCDRLLAFDHAARTVTLIALGETWTPELRRWRDSVQEKVAGSVARNAAASLPSRAAGWPPRPRPTVLWRDTDAEYLALIARCQAAIVEGEAYQLCLTAAATVEGEFDPGAVYAELRTASPTHHGGIVRIGGVSLLSSSPERFLAVSADGVIESKPIKGTRPRGTTPADDQRLREELLSSDKERAENLMIVDLMRNDIGRVCEVGSVRVPVLMAVESYAQVHQLVSTVRGQLAAGRHPIDAVEACFPAGSMTGAPKLRATQILAILERYPRGIYAGAFGYFGVDGSIDLAMVIRSIVLDAAGATIGSGGGITASSVPAEELAEVKLKAAVLLSVLGVGAEPGHRAE